MRSIDWTKELMKTGGKNVSGVALGFLLVVAPLAIGQTTAPPAPIVFPGAGRVTKSADRPQGVNSPVPTAIKTAKKLFLSNGGADAGLFPHPFTGTQDRAYGDLYSQLSSNKQFELTGTPSEAELVLEIELTAPSGTLGGDKKHGTEDALPTLRLKIYDGPTHYVLWTFTQTIDQANLQKTHDKNFDDAVSLLVAQFMLLTGPHS